MLRKKLSATLIAFLILMSIPSVIPAAASPQGVHTYDFRAEQRAFNTAYEGYDPSRPPTNLEPLGNEISDTNYDNIQASDNLRAYYSPGPTTQYEFHRFKFKIFEPVSSIASIYVEHEGYGSGPDGPGHSLFIWNHRISKWEQVDSTVAGDGDQILAGMYSSSLSDYVGPDGYLQLLAMPLSTSSCPFLYVWDGSKFQFIADINGGGGVGYYDASQTYDFRKPTPEGYTRIDGSQLAPSNGVYRLEIAEDQNEITYLDAVKLIAVDHTPDLEIYSNTLDTYSQNIPFKIQTVKNPRPPVSAIDGNGKDILPVIAKIDREYTEAHFYSFDTITLDLGDLNDAKQIKLLYNAYIDWPTSPEHAQRYQYIANHPEEQFDYLSYVEVINENGEWEKVSFELGFPQEKPRTAVLDITDWFKTDDYRLRIHNWHKIHIDYIAVDTSEDESVSLTDLDPVSAQLHWKGVSVQSSPDGKNPLIPDYYTATGLSGYSKYEGKFTRYGDVLPLVTGVDDKFVIMHAGNSVSLAFNEAPVPEGMERDYYLVSDAYYKENFVRYLLGQEISNVEPLPFHSMTTYPYPAGESYPYDAEHVAYLEEYNTREFPNIEQHNTIWTNYVKVDVTIAPVGGEIIPINTLMLLAPWIALSIAALAIGFTISKKKVLPH